MKKTKMTAGFTLVELIVVIAILGILAGVGTVGYSGYIKKANQAADEQLLSNLNTAFAATCAANGENHYGRNDTSITLGGSEGAKTVDTVTVADIADFNTSFRNFFGGGEFKIISHLLYSPKSGGFVETTAQMATLAERFRADYADEIKALAESNLGAMGAETLLMETADVVDWAAENGLLASAGTSFYSAFAGYLGITETDQESIRNAVMELAGNDENLAAQISANAIALYAAQNTTSVTADSVSAWLGSGKSTDDLQNNASANTLSEAAAIYGLYLSYKGDEFDSNGGALKVMGDALTDEAFAEWVNGEVGQAELNAYKSAMSVISGAADDEIAKDAVLKNGFSDPELIKLLESLMG